MKPATPLPWKADGLTLHSYGCRTERGTPTGAVVVAPFFREGFESGSSNCVYAAHAANAYPKLVDALRSTLGALEADAMRETDPQMRYYAERHHESVRALLRELGEVE